MSRVRVLFATRGRPLTVDVMNKGAGDLLVKVELHSHTNDDPADPIGHTAYELIDRAVALGYGALAITLHDRHFDDACVTEYARERGLVLMPSVERTIVGRHVLLLNAPAEAEQLDSFQALRNFKQRHPAALIVAPHPWFPLGNNLGGRLLEMHADLWDAVEVNAFYTRSVDFNRPARRWAEARGVPLVGNGDIHQLGQLGTTYSLVDVSGEATAASVCAAIKAGRVKVVSSPLSHWRAAEIAVRGILAGLTRRPW